MTDARKIIDYAYDDNGKEVRDALYSAIHDRVAAHFEAKKEEINQKLKAKLNKGLADMGLSVDTDLDVPYQNVVGFLIRLESFKLFIKNILNPESNGKTNNSEPAV